MKKISIILLILVLVLSSSIVYGEMESKLHNHWSYGMIDKSFLTYYFPYLSRNNFEKLNPRDSISAQDFKLSTASLLKSFGYEVSAVAEEEVFLRKDMVLYFGQILDELNIALDDGFEIPFGDVSTLNQNSRALLGALNNYGIIQGDPGSLFSPNRELSQAEAVIILQRVKGVLDKLNNVSFNVLGVVQSFNNQEEIVVTNDKDKVLVTITKQFPTPGYSMDITNIIKNKEGYKINLDIKSPDPDMNVIQVITYQTISIEIPKDELGDSPYNFILDGFNKIADRVSI
ncbi:MAG: hypothetical protein RIN55_02155 [Tissierellaceae bacterium]|nr:hypothetical protein [Tissierellaceae bacterium]